MANEKIYYVFRIVKWDETGRKLLASHKMTVQRKTLSNARTVVRKKYPARKGFFEELVDAYAK